VLSSWQVEDKVQRVADQGVDIPPEEAADLHNNLGLHEDDVVYVYDQAAAARTQREWVAAWERLDADLVQPQPEEDDDLDDYYNRQAAVNRRQNWQRQQRMDRRRAVAASQTRHGWNPFDEPAWAIPTTRPRTTFPHLEHQMSKEESDSWKMMELAEKIENSKMKRRRSPIEEETLLARMGVDLSMEPEKDGRKFKRPRTKRDSQLPAINTRNNINNSGESSSATEVTPATASTPTGNTSDAGSPPSGGLFTTLLEGIGKFQDVPIISAADVSGCNLARMRPISPDRSSVTSVISRSRSPPAIYSPSSPPSSRPTSPGDERPRGRPIYSPTSPTRTPAHSPTRNSRKRPWESQQPTPPPASRMQSPDGRSGKRQHSRSPEPSSRAGESSASDSDSSKQQQSKYNITRENKSDIVNMVSAVLKPFYPEKLSKETYTEINKKISRRMYKFICENGVMDKQQWHQAIEKEVKKEVHSL